MSKILFTVALHHDGRPQFIVSCNHLTALQISDLGVKIGNSNRNGFQNRFEYGISGNKGVTKLSLVMNTSVYLPPIQWASPRPSNPIIGKKHSSTSSSSHKKHSSHGPSPPPFRAHLGVDSAANKPSDHHLTNHSHGDRRSSRSSDSSSGHHRRRRRRQGEFADQAGYADDGDFGGYTGDD